MCLNIVHINVHTHHLGANDSNLLLASKINLRYVIFNLILEIDGWVIHCNFHWTSLMMSQHWHQAITWANVDPVPCRHMASLGHNVLNPMRLLHCCLKCLHCILYEGLDGWYRDLSSVTARISAINSLWFQKAFPRNWWPCYAIRVHSDFKHYFWVYNTQNLINIA